MILTLRSKLLVLILLGNALLLAIIFALNRYNFERDFTQYVQYQALSHQTSLIAELQQWWGDHHSWQTLREHPERWEDMLRRGHALDQRPIRPEPGAVAVPPPPMMPLPNDTARPIRPLDGNRRDLRPLPPRPVPPFPAHRPPMPAEAAPNERPALLDAQAMVVFGPPLPRSAWVTLELHYGDELIGFIAQPRNAHLSDDLDKAFIANQQRLFWSYIVVALLLSVVLAAAFSYWLGRRLAALANGARVLREGDYRYRLDVRTRDELGDLAHDFNVLAATLETSQKQREQWLADIAHELRTPVSVLRGEVEAMIDGVRPLSLPALPVLLQQVSQMQRLIDDLRTLSLPQQASLSLRVESVNTYQTLMDIVALNDIRCKERSLRVEIVADRDTEFQTDLIRWRQLLGNLMENSVRYTDPGGVIRIVLQRTVRGIALDWMDSAPGVPDASLARLFEHFYREEQSRNRASGGSGLGLAVCRAIVEAHHGSIVAKTSVLGGLCIAIEMPDLHR